MTPWQLASRTEHSHQRALFCWANCAAVFGFDIANDARGYTLAGREELSHLPKTNVPELQLLFAVHNQGHGDQIRGGRAKAEGVKAGVPDVMLPVPRRAGIHDAIQVAGLFIEMKLPGFTPSAVKLGQIRWHDLLREQGYRVEVCGGWRAAADVIQDYMP